MSRRRTLLACAGLATLILIATTMVVSPRPGPASATGGAEQVAGGGWHTCSLSVAGGVNCWGRNFDGQLGDGTTTDRAIPGDVSGLTSGVTSLAAGLNHTCALTAGGGVKCWGDNSDGQLGDGTTTDRTAPGDVSGLASGVTALAAGGWHTCAVTTGGGVKCWGLNFLGQLGDGTTTDRAAPGDVSGLTSSVTSLAAGSTHTCALTAAGGVKCWGDNNKGQLGDGTTADRAAPVAVSGLESGVTAIAAGESHTCALTTAGGVKCWGDNLDGQLGDGTTTDRAAPGNVSGLASGVTALAAGNRHTCALTEGGGVKCWGDNVEGQLGDGTTTSRAAPGNVSGLASGVTALDAGGWHSCVLTSGGNIKCWGANYFGRLGDGTTTNRTTPVRVVNWYNWSSYSPGWVIPDDFPTGIADHLVAAEGGVIEDLNVFLDITHPYVGDLVVTLTHGDTGTSAVLIDRPATAGGTAGIIFTTCDGADIRAVLDDEAPSAVEGECDTGTPTISGDFTPVGSLSVFDGERAAGTWSLRVSDNGGIDVGTLNAWSLYVVETAKEPTPTPTPTATATATSTATATPPVAPTATPPATPTATLFAPATATSPAPTPTTPVGGLPGDVDCSGTVNAIDTALLLQFGAGLIGSLACEQNADTNSDGTLNAIDAALILQYIAGLVASLPP